MAFAIALSVLLASSSLLLIQFAVVVPADAARAFFVFGDSLVDNGNNNYLMTIARANAYPYGIDSPSHQPTGRFSNGLNIPDIISEHLGAEPTLPYLNPELQGDKLLVGANFASAGVGILNDTGFQFINIIRMGQQLDYFLEYQQRLSALVGEEKAAAMVRDSLVLITLGGNDFVNNYYLVPNSLRSREFSVPDYVAYIISEYKKILARLYETGARHVLVTGTGPIGCAPGILATRSLDGSCVQEIANAAALFDSHLFEILNDLNNEIGSPVFTTANTNKMHFNFITDPSAFGFITSNVACCGQGRFNGMGLCGQSSSLCPNRDLYVFWDAYHPTERANRIIVNAILNGDENYMSPMNLSTMLLAMDEGRI